MLLDSLVTTNLQIQQGQKNIKDKENKQQSNKHCSSVGCRNRLWEHIHLSMCHSGPRLAYQLK